MHARRRGVALGERERRARGRQRCEELARQRIVRGGVELPPRRLELPAQRVQLPGAARRSAVAVRERSIRAASANRSAASSQRPRRSRSSAPLTYMKCPNEPRSPSRGRLALAVHHRRQRAGVVAAHAQQLAQVQVGARGLLAGLGQLERAAQVRLARLGLAEVGQHDARA